MGAPGRTRTCALTIMALTCARGGVQVVQVRDRRFEPAPIHGASRDQRVQRMSKLVGVGRGRAPMGYPFQECVDGVGLRGCDAITGWTVHVTDVECDSQIAAHSVDSGGRGCGLSVWTRGVERGWGEGHKGS